MATKITREKLAGWRNSPVAFVEDAFAALGLKIYDFQRELVESLTPALLAISRNEKPAEGVRTRAWVEWTKGAGKDLMLACLHLWALAFWHRHGDLQSAANDREQAADELKWVRKVIEAMGLGSLVEVQAFAITNPNTGTTCQVVATEISGAHGARPEFLSINEAHAGKEEFQQTLLNNASKVNGIVLVLTNAGIKGSFSWTLREIARTTPERWIFSQLAQPAPNISEAELEESGRRNPRSQHRRWWWGEWSTSSGDALDEADLKAAIDPNIAMMAGFENGWIFTGGLDLGIRHDHSGLIILGTNIKTRRMRVAYAKAWKPGADGKVKLPDVRADVLAAAKRFKTKSIGYDPYQADLMAADLTRERVKMVEVVFTGANLTNMASVMLETFRTHAIDIPPHTDLIRDLGRLSIVEKSYGFRLDSTRDADGHADLATALAICLPLATTAKAFTFSVGSADSGTPRYGRPEDCPGTLSHAIRGFRF